MLDRAPQQTEGAATEPPRPVEFRGGGFVPSVGRYGGWIALALVLALWQLAGSAGWVNALFLPPPSAIAMAIWKLALSGALWQHVSWSIMRPLCPASGHVRGYPRRVGCRFARALRCRGRAPA